MVAKDIKGTGSAKVQRVPFNIPGQLNDCFSVFRFITDLQVLNQIKEFRIEALQADLEEMILNEFANEVLFNTVTWNISLNEVPVSVALARDVIEQQTSEEIEELHQCKAIRKAEFEETYALSHAENDVEAAHVKILSLGSSVNVEPSQHRGGGCQD
ncbi:hypothetical protein POM88_040542 [Heracleum sosnowskyi]|uniref:Uncharacterized protein n=1 Tax=Heracleum sosnowskyi TaxID=360622 RepID=A0AAD8M8X1_9APIA|nr:hypothetical protein POM88_040542 [Heracleum sosnowskyi]